MKILTTRFGEVEFEEKQILEIPGGLIGFPQCERFVLLEHAAGSPYRWLQCVDEPSMAFLVINPSTVVSDYEFRPSHGVAELLALSDETLKMVLAIVTVPRRMSTEATVNLIAPIVINLERRVGKQVILEDSGWGIRHRIYRSNEELSTGEEKVA